MSLAAVLVLLLAAALHAGWNLLVKQADDKQIFAWWALVAGLPLSLLVAAAGRPWPPRVWPYALASAAGEVAYFAALATAYRLADFSLAYPLARGTAPLLLALWAVLWLGERVGGWGVLGLLVLVLGLLVVGGGSGRRSARGAGRPWAGIAAAMAVAVLISIYSAIDAAAVRFVAPAPYTALVLSLSVPLITPVVLARSSRQALFSEWRRHWPRIVLVGPLTLASYGLVLFAYTLAPVAYAGAVREVSVIFAALAGWRWLGEPMGRMRLAGAVLICAGVLVVALAG